MAEKYHVELEFHYRVRLFEEAVEDLIGEYFFEDELEKVETELGNLSIKDFIKGYRTKHK